jgi:hypothetical protein
MTDDAAGLETIDLAIADADEERRVIGEAPLHLPAPAELDVGAGHAAVCARDDLDALSFGIDQPGSRSGEDRAAERVAAVLDRRAAALHLEIVDRARIHGEKILVRALTVDAVVHAHAIEEVNHLLSRHPADVRARLAVRRLLHVDARLIAEGVRRRAGEPLLELRRRRATRRFGRVGNSGVVGDGSGGGESVSVSVPVCVRVTVSVVWSRLGSGHQGRGESEEQPEADGLRHPRTLPGDFRIEKRSGTMRP